jgi:hypothetical protein
VTRWDRDLMREIGFEHAMKSSEMGNGTNHGKLLGAKKRRS